MRVRIKICGITRVEDALCAANLGVDALGLMFYPQSPRHVSLESAVAIGKAIPPLVDLVGVFVDASEETITDILSKVPLTLLQFHGSEAPAFCGSFGLPYLKSVRVSAGIDIVQIANKYHSAKALLLDAYVKGIPGGTGECFDWSLIPKALDVPILLAGGLNPSNVARAITNVRPYGLDVSGGVEESKGRKDSQKMRAFVAAVQQASRSIE